MKQKSEAFAHFKKLMVEKQTSFLIKCIRLDGGGEYFSNEFLDFLRKKWDTQKSHTQVHSAAKWSCSIKK